MGDHEGAKGNHTKIYNDHQNEIDKGLKLAEEGEQLNAKLRDHREIQEKCKKDLVKEHEEAQAMMENAHEVTMKLNHSKLEAEHFERSQSYEQQIKKISEENRILSQKHEENSEATEIDHYVKELIKAKDEIRRYRHQYRNVLVSLLATLFVMYCFHSP